MKFLQFVDFDEQKNALLYKTNYSLPLNQFVEHVQNVQ